jgi:hypothetical protein
MDVRPPDMPAPDSGGTNLRNPPSSSSPTVPQRPPNGCATPSAPARPDRPPFVATRFGRYELRGVLGRGGMGVVYEAHDPLLNRLVALKRIARQAIRDPDDARRFRAEAQAAAQFDHRHIVTVHDVGEESGETYFTMTLVRGGTLAGCREALRADPRRAVSLVSKVARAVGYAHGRGVVHRDLKPANILIDESGEPRVSDFGLAKVVGVEAAWNEHGRRMGTPGYMAPEQARGESERIGPASDVWALGVILYELLGGRRPFAADERHSLTHQICSCDPSPLAGLSPGVPRELERIVSRCLEKDPAKRYPTADPLADDLERWLAKGPGRGRTLSRRACVAALAGVPLLLGVGSYYYFSSDPELAELQRRFQAGQTVTLVGETGVPRWYRFRTEADRPPLKVVGDLRVRSPESLLLIELFPAIHGTAFRLRAQVKHSHAAGAVVGVYFGHLEETKGTAAGHWLWAVQFSDLGANPDAPRLQALFYRPPDGGKNNPLFSLSNRPGVREPKDADTWRDLTVEVNAKGITAQVGAKSSWSFTHDELANFAVPSPGARAQARQLPHGPVLPALEDCPRVDGWGGIGLVVHKGEARFRSVTLEPINVP